MPAPKSPNIAQMAAAQNAYALVNDQKQAPNGAHAPARLADDLLRSAQAIADEIGIPLRAAFYLLENHKLPARKVGGRWHSTRSALAAHYAMYPVESDSTHATTSADLSDDTRKAG